ncbi:MAG: ABC transporter ATP-binding protein, partial [Candidatus Thermoplasmatota archaeon]|nr:ABC transporter ATP-binding protein [Candidatus Thermoplasmatota archaeon]
GEFVSVMGPSGCGKSTLMNLIGCLDRPTSGKVFIEGNDTSVLSDNRLAGLRSNTVGFVFQTFNLIPRISALKNVAMPLVFAGVQRGERERMAREILESVGLGKRISYTPDKLSGGERQRVAIARALVNDPKIILADEPTGNLDSNTGKEIMETIKGLNKQGKTIILVTHDQKVADYADATYRMRDGRIESIEISRGGV